jgi:hypothetical protein
MKASELRIGNYVKFDNHEDEYYKVSGCDISELSDELIDLNASPIQLTEEWLLMFGFIRHHYDYANDVIYIKNIADNEIDNAEFEWGVYPNELGSGIQIKNRKSLKYVHQLQNLYWCLCGEELTFKSE